MVSSISLFARVLVAPFLSSCSLCNGPFWGFGNTTSYSALAPLFLLLLLFSWSKRNLAPISTSLPPGSSSASPSSQVC
ncbi:hypothetical protein GOP47_0007668 [Adiantum capillus-veneris]|uniref:Uncharacterized protein n=1 Tax=Adiantum capillus-veneris TaxID=13818 RepID=A0A9D4ZJI5_ADICA|nr:hypothetical protein GOP47_0007668 [Adiantum capillus-veneris]